MHIQHLNQQHYFLNINLDHVFPAKITQEAYSLNMPKIKDRSIHNCMQVGYCVEGNGYFDINGKVYNYSKGFLSVVPAYTPHRCLFSRNVNNEWRWLYFDNIYFSRFLNLVEINPLLLNSNEAIEACFIPACESTASLVSIIDSIYLEQRSTSANHETLKHLIVALINKLFEITNSPTNTPSVEESKIDCHLAAIHPAISYISENFADKITLKDLAGACHMSESGLRVAFNDIFHCSPTQYVSIFRIEKACSLILTNKYSLQEISDMVGFSCYSSFLRHFQRLLNQSPSAWWKKNVSVK